MTPERLPALVNDDPVLRRWGRHLSLRDGQVAEVRKGPFLMPSWRFALRAEPEAWRTFLSPEPPPGRHDLFALIRCGALRIEGDLHPFMSHILWFKGAFDALRSTTA
jgi:hypothetical protein